MWCESVEAIHGASANSSSNIFLVRTYQYETLEGA